MIKGFQERNSAHGLKVCAIQSSKHRMKVVSGIACYASDDRRIRDNWQADSMPTPCMLIVSRRRLAFRRRYNIWLGWPRRTAERSLLGSLGFSS